MQKITFHCQYIALFLFFWIMLCQISPAYAKPSKGKERAKALVALLGEMEEREKIVPDSFFSDVELLRTEIAQETDSVAKSVYRAALAHLLSLNMFRSQARQHQTASHPDSLKEWSQEDYRYHIAKLYSQSLSDMELLHATSTSEWLPLLKIGNEENVFGRDMLSVIWHSLESDLAQTFRAKANTPDYADLIAFYHAKGLREAEVLLVLDSLYATTYSPSEQRETLLALRDRFCDTPACALVYLRLSECDNPSILNGEDAQNRLKEEQLQWAAEGLRLYPAFSKKALLEDRVRWLQRPQLQGGFNRMYYPESLVSTPLYVANMKQAVFRIYQLPPDFKCTEDHMTYSAQVVKAGRLLKTIRHRFESRKPSETWTDTLHWKTPGYGNYAIVMEGKTEAALSRKMESEVAFFDVSSLACLSTYLPDGMLRIHAVDAQSGEPRKNVVVDFYTENKGKEVLLTRRNTDSYGRADLKAASSYHRNSLKVRLSYGNDNASAPVPVSVNLYQDPMQADSVRYLRIFTDRSIYRPGQKVYVAALAYKQKDWGARVETGRKYTLMFYDANRQLLHQNELRTDAYGVLSDTLVLPESGLPGEYMIRIGAQMAWIKVEEYRRPTFRVEVEELPEYQFTDDSVTVKGRAITFSGVPLRNARVTGVAKWRGSHWWRNYYASSSETVDTVYTDHEGRFAVRVPVQKDVEKMKWGQWLSVTVDVLNQQGETQQGEAQMHFCSEPLRLFADVEEMQDKSRLSEWRFNLLSSVEKQIEAPISCRLVSEKATHAFVVQSGSSRVPEELRELPSGKYMLYAKAKVGTDSVRYQKRIVLFGDEDSRPVLDTALWVYAPVDTFDVKKPARIRMGTALKKGWLHVLLVAGGKVVSDSTLFLSDSLVTWDIPYKEEYNHGARCVVTLFQGGKMYSHTSSLLLRRPDTRLRFRWDVFRNLTRPGAKEEWRLSLFRPDGAPAQANVLLSLYDASLSALAPHSLNLSLSRPHHIASVRIFGSTGFSGNSNRADLLMEIKRSKVQDYVFTTLNEALFPSFARAETFATGKFVQARSTMAPAKMAAAGLGQVMEDSNTTLETDESEEALSNEGLPSMENFRENMQELAFFAPQLRTDSNGQASISFTLPESMTAWRMTGFAHTPDLYVTGIEETVVAQKELMAELYLPRFLRIGDKTELAASIRNISQKPQHGTAIWELLDAETEKVLSTLSFSFSLAANSDTTYRISVEADAMHTLLVVQWKASSEAGSDGERRVLPVLSDRQLVTTTQAIQLDGPQNRRIDLQSLFPKNAEDRSLTVEYTSQPIWLALQSLPSLAAPRKQDVLSLSAAYYAGVLAQYVMQRNAEVGETIQKWAQTGKKESTLYENQQLASILMHETPWVMQAYDEAERKERLQLLFQTEGHLQRAMSHLSALKALQQSDGSFSWYPGMKGSPYLTGEVVFLLTRLQRMTQDMVPDAATETAAALQHRAIAFIRQQVHNEVLRAKEKPDLYQMSLQSRQYLYAVADETLTGEAKKDVQFLLSHLQQHASRYQLEDRAFAAILLHLYGQSKKAKELLPELRLLLQHSDGIYLAYPSGTFVSIDRKIQRHVLLMETFARLAPEDTVLLMGMQQWLLEQKRTQEWEQPIQTADAVYALMQTGDLTVTGVETVDEIRVSGLKIASGQKENQACLGTMRQSFAEPLLPKHLTFHKQTKGSSWGAIYAQYTTAAKEVQAQGTGLTLRRELSSTDLYSGQRIQVRYVLTVHRDYEFVRLNMPRISGAEPEVQQSGYRWKNGLGYYCAIHDTGTEYFFDSLPKGTYVLEEDWLVSRAGTFQWAPAQIQCLYAPAYQARTQGTELIVKP